MEENFSDLFDTVADAIEEATGEDPERLWKTCLALWKSRKQVSAFLAGHIRIHVEGRISASR